MHQFYFCNISLQKKIIYIYKGKEKMCGNVWCSCPILGIYALHLTHPCAHTVVSSEQTNTHTRTHTHTPTRTRTEQWAVIFPATPGEQLGVRCLAQCSHLSRGIDLVIHSLHLQSLPVPRLKPTTFGLQVRLSNL